MDDNTSYTVYVRNAPIIIFEEPTTSYNIEVVYS